MKKRYLGYFVLMFCLCTIATSTTIKADAKTYSGKYGSNITWNYNTKTKVLTFSGKGAMKEPDRMYTDNYHWETDWDAVAQPARKVVFGKGITRICTQCCFSLTNVDVVYIPDTVTSIGGGAFGSVNASISLKKIIIQGNNIKEIGRECFAKSKILKFTFPSKIKKIPYECFAYSAIEKVTLPENCKEIGVSAFADCENLRKVKLPDGLEKIGNCAFDYAGLEKVTIPKNVKKNRGGCVWIL